MIGILAIPPLAAALCWVPLGKGRFAAGTTIGASLAVMVLAIRLAMASAWGAHMAPEGNWIACDGLGLLIVLLVAFTSLLASVYSWGYMAARARDVGATRVARYYAFYNLFVGAMLAVLMFSQISLVWIAVELTTLFSVFLVSFERSPEALEAAWKYAVLTCMGAALALFGVVLFYWGVRLGGGGPFTWASLTAASPKMPTALVGTAFVFVLIGFGAKAGLAPLHTWLPDAHSQAPSPICALLSGVETTTALYVIIKFLSPLAAARQGPVGPWLVGAGLLSAGVASILILQVKDYKRLFAFSTVEHMGIILVAVGLAEPALQLAGCYQIMSHAITKSLCFFVAGLVLMATGTRNIKDVRGLIRTSPMAGAALMLAGLAIAGAPPFAVFLSEFSILRAGLASGHYVTIGLLTLFIAIAFWGIMAHVARMAFGSPGQTLHAHPLPLSCRICVVVGLAPVVLFGVYIPGPLHTLLQAAAASCLGS